MTWIEDNNGNRCSVERWGSKEAAHKALWSNKTVRAVRTVRTVRAVRLFDCSGCSGCSRCSGCLGCSNCSDCSDCSSCSGCSDCSRCLGCSGCLGCSNCSRCSGCLCLEDAAPAVQKSQSLIIPVVENLHAKIYAAATVTPESLDMSNVHGCSTTHCRAGWAVHLAGDAGYALEKRFGWELAAMKIYDASCPGYEISPVRFHDSDEDALADMKKLAGV